MSDDPAWSLWQLSDLSAPWALRVVTTLGVADLVADGLRSAAELAARTDTDAASLARVLRNCVARGVFAEESPGQFTQTPMSECLCAGHPSRMNQWLRTDGAADRMDRAYAALMSSVLTGRAAYEQIHGAPFYDDLQADPALQQSFDDLMSGDAIDYAGILDQIAPHGHLVDVGGGQGDLAVAALRRDDSLTAGVFELPGTANHARVALAPFGPRASVFTGDFLEAVKPEGGDVYVLAAVLHNWCDADAVEILRNVAAAARPGGRVVLVENVPTDAVDARWSTHLDLKMLVMLGGRERSAQEYLEMAELAGLVPGEVVVTSRGPFALPCAVISATVPG